MESTEHLPSATDAGEESTAFSHAADSEAPLILMVDDDATLRMLFERYLTAFGYTPLLAADGKEALRIAQETPGIRIVILDLMMPGLSARELTARLAALLPRATIVFCSGHPKNTLVRLGIEIRDAHFMQKPCRPLELKQRLSEILAVA